jgi:hypothetical protein
MLAALEARSLELPDDDDGCPRFIDERGVLTVVVRRPRCPSCTSTEYTTMRSDDNGDGTRTRHQKCRCGFRFRVLIE